MLGINHLRSTVVFFFQTGSNLKAHDLNLLMQVLGVKAPPVRIDSQAKYGAMARGDAVIYLRFPHLGYREKIWDHAAGAIVITGTCSRNLRHRYVPLGCLCK